MYLTIDGQRSALIAPFQALGFNGASGVSCEIVGGPLLDFNVIYREAALRATVSWCGAGTWSHQGGLRILFNAGPALRVSVGDQRYLLEHYDSLLVDEAVALSKPRTTTQEREIRDISTGSLSSNRALPPGKSVSWRRLPATARG